MGDRAPFQNCLTAQQGFLFFCVATAVWLGHVVMQGPFTSPSALTTAAYLAVATLVIAATRPPTPGDVDYSG